MPFFNKLFIIIIITTIWYFFQLTNRSRLPLIQNRKNRPKQPEISSKETMLCSDF